MIHFIKVTGNSLSPRFREGDYVVIVTCPFFEFKTGDTIVFRHPAHGLLIKKIKTVDSDKIHVIGTHPHSVDSRRFGPIDRKDVLGKVVIHIKKPGR